MTSPEGVVVNWDFNHLKKDELLDITHKLINRFKTGVNDIVAQPNLSFTSVLKVNYLNI